MNSGEKRFSLMRARTKESGRVRLFLTRRFFLWGRLRRRENLFRKSISRQTPAMRLTLKFFRAVLSLSRKESAGGGFCLVFFPFVFRVGKGDFVGFLPKRGVPYASAIFFLGEVVGEARTESTIFKAVRAVSPVLPASLTMIFILP